VFIKSDFDQLEYKMTAVVSGDPVMIDIFKRGDDIHTGTTKEIVGPVMFGIKAEDWDKQDKEVKKSQRKIGKTMNFAALYGMGIKSLSKRLGVTEEVAKQILDGMLSKFKKYAQFKEREVAHSRKYGFSRTFWFGANPGEFEPFRKRMNQGITSKDNGVKAKAERIATNSCIQGFASDLCIFAMIRLVQWIDENFIPAELVMTIHDALIIHCHKDYVEEVAYFMKVIMEDYSCGDVPITVSTDVGETWGLMIPYDEEVGRLIRMYGYSAALEFYRAEQAKKNKKA
jgi:DNA polymerase-1